jgi:hypothetical protein
MNTQHGDRNEYSKNESESDDEIHKVIPNTIKRKLVEIEDEYDLQFAAYLSPQYDLFSKINGFQKQLKITKENKELEETLKKNVQ